MRYLYALFITTVLSSWLISCQPVGTFEFDDDTTADDDTGDDDTADDDDDNTSDDDTGDDDTIPPPLELVVELHPDSVDDYVEPGWTDALIIIVTTNQLVTLEYLPLTVNVTDNAETGWADFDQMANPNRYQLWEIELPVLLEIEVLWGFSYFEDGDFGYLLANLNYQIEPGSRVFKLFIGTTGASGLMHDTLQVNIDQLELFLFQDENGDWHNGYEVAGLPLEGPTKTFILP